jgi:hypothetical protein
LPDIVEWCRRNIDKVQHVSLITFRSIPLTPSTEYRVDGVAVDASTLQHSTTDVEEIGLTTDEMLDVLHEHDPPFRPAAYLPGTSTTDSYKFLVAVQVGTKRETLGCLGPHTMECVQVFHHLLTGRYCSFLRRTNVGRSVFVMALIDRSVRKAAARYARTVLKDIRRLFTGIHVQSISLQQPNELLNGETNLCDGCLNMMVFEGRLIPSCRLDEYRLFGGPLVPVARGANAAPTVYPHEEAPEGQGAQTRKT